MSGTFLVNAVILGLVWAVISMLGVNSPVLNVVFAFLIGLLTYYHFKLKRGNHHGTEKRTS